MEVMNLWHTTALQSSCMTSQAGKLLLNAQDVCSPGSVPVMGFCGPERKLKQFSDPLMN